jgi:hypothetical protein
MRIRREKVMRKYLDRIIYFYIECNMSHYCKICAGGEFPKKEGFAYPEAPKKVAKKRNVKTRKSAKNRTKLVSRSKTSAMAPTGG